MIARLVWKGESRERKWARGIEGWEGQRERWEGNRSGEREKITLTDVTIKE